MYIYIYVYIYILLYIYINVVKLSTITIDLYRQRVTKKRSIRRRNRRRKTKGGRNCTVYGWYTVARFPRRQNKNIHHLSSRGSVRTRTTLIYISIGVYIHIYIRIYIYIYNTRNKRSQREGIHGFRSSEGYAKWARCGRKSCSTMSSDGPSRYQSANDSSPVQLVLSRAVPSRVEPCLTRRYSRFL